MFPHLHLGTSPESIEAAASALGVTFPSELAAIWSVSNGVELPGGWRFLPVFNPQEPRKTSNHIVYENTKGRWEIMSPDLLAIARGDTGNIVALRKAGDALDPTVLVWNHETRRTKPWARDLAYIAALARARVAKIEKQIARSTQRRQ